MLCLYFSDALPALGSELEVMDTDVFETSAIDRAVAGSDAVISTLDVPYSRHRIEVYSKGTGHVVAAMQRQGIRRLLCVSSTTTYLDQDPQAGWINHLGVWLVSSTVGRSTYDDMRRMEALVRGSGLEWTIVRPAGLSTDQLVTPYQMAETVLSGRFTAHADLAACLLSQVQDPRSIGKTLFVVTTQNTPSVTEWFRGEILKQA